MGIEQAFGVFRKQINFQIQQVSHLSVMKSSGDPSLGDDGDPETTAIVVAACQGQADAI
jgi:hypothetical protein